MASKVAESSAASSILRLDRETLFAGAFSGISPTFSSATSSSAGFELDDLLRGDGLPVVPLSFSVPVKGSSPSLEGETCSAAFASGIFSSTGARLLRETRFFVVAPLVDKIWSVLTTVSGRIAVSITFVLENLFERLAGLSSGLAPCCSLLERLRPPPGDLGARCLAE